MTEPPTAYAWVTTIPHAVTEDEPRLRAHLRHSEAQARAKAEAEGFVLTGHPNVTALALVYVPGPDDEDGSLVSPDWARAMGLDPDTLPRHVALRLEWPL